MTLVSLDDVKTELRMTDSTNDAQLLMFIDSITEVVQSITGPVVPTTYTEWHNGGRDTVLLRHRPVISIASVVEWQGAVSYTLNDATPPGDVMDVFGYMPFLDRGVIQRTAYGVPSWFSALPWWATRTPAWFTGQQNRASVGLGRVQVTYTAGRSPVPANITHGTLEIIRDNWQQTQQGGRPRFASSGAEEEAVGNTYMGFFVSTRARGLLLPHQQSRQIG